MTKNQINEFSCCLTADKNCTNHTKFKVTFPTSNYSIPVPPDGSVRPKVIAVAKDGFVPYVLPNHNVAEGMYV